MLFCSSEMLCFCRSLCPLGHGCRGMLKLGRRKTTENWEEVEVQHCFGSVVTLCNEHSQISWEGAASPHSPTGRLPVLFPCLPDAPLPAARSLSYSSLSPQLSLAAHDAARLDATQTLCYGFTSPACLSACLEMLITVRRQSE